MFCIVTAVGVYVLYCDSGRCTVLKSSNCFSCRKPILDSWGGEQQVVFLSNYAGLPLHG